MSTRFRSLLAVGVLVASGAAAAVVGTTMAHADTKICEQYGSTTIGGKYVVMNNRWGTTAEQCINVTDNGFSIASQQGTGNMSGAPVSYPAIFVGCHYTNCSPGTNLPMQLSSIRSVNSSISYNYVSGATYDAAYDIWLDPTAKKDGVNQTEIMIWFNRQGSIQPIGSVVGNATIGGKSWQVWTGNNGSNQVISFVASSTISSWSFSVLDFLNETVRRGMATNSWYLTSIQAGFEPWVGGTGLAVTSFSADINGGGNNSSSSSSTTPSRYSPSRSSSSSSSSSSSTGTGTGGCSAALTVANAWSGGFVANVNVTAGNSAIGGWKVTLNLPSGSISNAWSGQVSGSGGTVTVTNASYNGQLSAGASTSFGFQGTGSATGATASCSVS